MRTGKIARLPYPLRDQLNCRLLNGEPGASVLEWLNALPDTQTILAREFNAVPISPANLSEWTHGGYQEWLARQGAKDLLLIMEEEDDDQPNNLPRLGLVANKAARWFTLHFVAHAAQILADPNPDPDVRLRRLHQLCTDITRLQREEQHARRLDLDQQRLDLEASQIHLQNHKEGLKAKLAARCMARAYTEVTGKPCPVPFEDDFAPPTDPADMTDPADSTDPEPSTDPELPSDLEPQTDPEPAPSPTPREPKRPCHTPALSNLKSSNLKCPHRSSHSTPPPPPQIRAIPGIRGPSPVPAPSPAPPPIHPSHSSHSSHPSNPSNPSDPSPPSPTPPPILTNSNQF